MRVALKTVELVDLTRDVSHVRSPPIDHCLPRKGDASRHVLKAISRTVIDA